MALHQILDVRLLVAALVVLAIVAALYVTFSGFSMVGITPFEVTLLLFISPFLAPINLPVWPMDGVVIGVNLAGLGVPLFLSLRMLHSKRLPAWKGLVGAGIVTVFAYEFATVTEGGILVPALAMMLVTAVVGMSLAGTKWRQLGPTTYVSGAIGTLVGADLLNLGALASAGGEETRFAVIGGAGTLDAIYLISLWAVVGTILAAVLTRMLGAGNSSGS